MAALDDLLVAFDSYMKTNAKPGSAGGKYLATKLAAIFEDGKSPLSTKKGGVMDTLAKKVLKLSDKIGKLADDKGLADLSKNINTLNGAVKRLTTSPRNSPTVDNTAKNHANLMNSLFKGLRTSLYLTKGIKVEVVGMNKELLKEFGRQFERAAVAAQEDFAESAVEVKRDSIFTKLGNYFAKQKPDNQYAYLDKYFKNRPKSPNGIKDEGGIISTVMSWVKNISLILGGVFLVGKLKKYLDTIEFGQILYKNVGDAFDTIFSFSAGVLQKLNIGQSIAEGFDAIGGIFKSITNYVSGWWDKNKDYITKQFDTVKDSIWNNILAPIGNGLKTFLTGVDWGKLLATAGNFVYDNIIKPVFNSIGESITKGDWMGAAGKTVLTLLAASFLPGLTSLLSAFSGVSGLVMRLVPILGGLALSPLGLTLITLGTTFALVNNAAQKLQTELDKNKKGYEKQSANSDRVNSVLQQELNELKAKKNLTYSDKSKMKELELGIQLENLNKKYAEKNNHATKRLDSFWGKLREGITGKVKNEISKNHEAFENEQSSIYERIQHLSKVRKLDAEKDDVRAHKKQEGVNIAQSIIAARNKNAESKKQFSLSSANPIVVQPSKPVTDAQIHPYLKQLDDTMNKLHDVNVQVKDTLDNLAAVTVEGHNQVTKAVIMTAPKAAPSNNDQPFGSFYDPVADFRYRSDLFHKK